MRTVRIIMSYMLIILIPLAIICLSMNVTLRAPDVYQYSFRSTEALNKAEAGIKDDVMGEYLSDYMLHLGEEEFQMHVDGDEEGAPLFTERDQQGMAGLRTAVDVAAILGAISLLSVIGLYWYFLNAERMLVLRVRFKMACGVFVGCLALAAVAFFVPAISDGLLNLVFAGGLGDADMLPLLLCRHFAGSFIVSTSVIAAILMVLAGYATWRLTKPKMMFW